MADSLKLAGTTARQRVVLKRLAMLMDKAERCGALHYIAGFADSGGTISGFRDALADALLSFARARPASEPPAGDGETPDAWLVEVSTPGDGYGVLAEVYLDEPQARLVAQQERKQYPHHVIAVVPLYRRDTR